MGFLDFLTGPETVETSSQYKPSKLEKPIYQSALNQLLGYMNTPQSYYPGQGYVGMSDATQQGMNSLLGGAGNVGAMQSPFQQSWQRNLSASDVANQPHVQAMLQANQQQLNQNLQRNLLPGIQQGAVQAGGMNSARQGIAQGVAMGDTQSALANANAATLGNAYNAGLGAEANAMRASPTLAALYGQPAQMQLGAGQIGEEYQGRELQDQMARHYWGQQELQNRLGFTLPMLQNARLGTQTGTEPNPGYTSIGNIVGNIVGAKPWT